MKHFYKLLTLIIFASLFLPKGINAQCTLTVPYYESFTVSANNVLPTCWAASNLSNTCLTYTTSYNQNRIPRTGTQFASFSYTPAGQSYFYTNGIYLNAGSTYSVSLWYTTDVIGSTNWTDLSILIGSSQSTTGLIQVASTNTTAMSPSYISLSNTFSTSVSGLYYIAVRATSNGSCCASYLSWDDFLITQICPNLSIAPSATAVCNNETVTLTATGATNYTWSTGSTSSVITVTPNGNSSYTVTGTNTVSGCTSSKTITIGASPKPVVAIFSSNTVICDGSSVNLQAFGASTYTWSNGTISSSNLVSPTVTTVYTVTGANSFGCANTATRQIVVNPTPTVSASSSNSIICEGQTVTLTASGASTYSWSTPSGNSTGAVLTVTLNSSGTYVVVGAATNGCTGNTSISLNIADCTGLRTGALEDTELRVFPNPSDGEFTVDANEKIENIQVYDACGKIVLSVKPENTSSFIDLKAMSGGLYYVKIFTQKGNAGIKLLKL